MERLEESIDIGEEPWYSRVQVLSSPLRDCEFGCKYRCRGGIVHVDLPKLRIWGGFCWASHNENLIGSVGRKRNLSMGKARGIYKWKQGTGMWD